MITLDYALDAVMLLSPEQREMLIEVIRKQQIENIRKDIAEDAQEAIEDEKVYHQKDAEGFIRLNALRLRIQKMLNRL